MSKKTAMLHVRAGNTDSLGKRRELMRRALNKKAQKTDSECRLLTSKGMSFQLQLKEMPGYIAAKFIGSGAAEEVWRQFELVAAHCQRAKVDKLLIDITKAEGTLSLTDKYMAAEESRIFARLGIKVAFIEIPERVDPRKFFLLAARNRGVNVEAFTDWKAAEEWLLK